MTILKPAPTSLNRFTFLKDENLLVAEMSDLPAGFGPVYDDACDEGLTVVSQHTGREATYGVVDEMRRDGELTGWILKPAAPADRDLPTIHIYND